MSLNTANYNMGKLLETDVLINQGLINDDNNILSQAELTNNIVSIESIEQNQKEVNEIFIRYAKNNNHFNHADKQRLKELAALCPETEGTAIYQARTLVSKFDNTAYYNECELIDPTLVNNSNNRVAKQLITDLTTNLILNVYPNPTENEIFIESDIIKESDVIEIMIYSSIGALTKKIDYTGLSVYKIDLSHLNNGTYIYKIKLNGVIVKSDKLIIIK